MIKGKSYLPLLLMLYIQSPMRIQNTQKKENGIIKVVRYFGVPTNPPASFLLKFFNTCYRLVWVVLHRAL